MGGRMRQAPTRRLYRSRDHRLIAGVAGGIAEYLGIDPTIVRILWVVGALLMPPMTAPIAVLIYLALALIIPLEPPGE